MMSQSQRVANNRNEWFCHTLCGVGGDWCEGTHSSNITSSLCFLTNCDESFVTPAASPAGPSLGDSPVSLLVWWEMAPAEHRDVGERAGQLHPMGTPGEHHPLGQVREAGLVPLRLTKVPCCSGHLGSRRARGRALILGLLRILVVAMPAGAGEGGVLLSLGWLIPPALCGGQQIAGVVWLSGKVC